MEIKLEIPVRALYYLLDYYHWIDETEMEVGGYEKRSSVVPLPR